MGTVFICHDAPKTVHRKKAPISRDYTPAQKFGEVKVVIQGPVDTGSKEVREQIREAMKGFNPETDFLLAAGSAVIIAACVADVLEQNNYVNVLEWERKARAYLVREIAV